jgi:L-alanine-DL-glutamate epimerase-like enolase superfamily enzyme
MASDPTIAAVEVIPLVVPGVRDFRISEGSTRTHVSVIVRLRASVDGLEGIGEIVSAPPGKPEEILEEIVAAVTKHAAPALIGVRVADRAEAMSRVEAALKGRIWTKAGINNALHDLHARLLGVSVSHLIGGRRRQQVPVMGLVISMMSPDDMARAAAREVAAGYDTVKLKVGETPERDAARVAAVREAVGGKVTLRVDANDHYCATDAIRLIRLIERYAPEHVEQPVARGDLLGMAEVCANVGVPVMTDDMIGTPQDAMNVIRLRAANRVKVKVTKHGIDGALLLTRMLGAAGIPCVLGHVFEMGLAGLAEAHVGAVASNLVFPCEIGSLQPMGVTQDIINETLQPRPGVIDLPAGSGLGATLNHAAVREWQVPV